MVLDVVGSNPTSRPNPSINSKVLSEYVWGRTAQRTQNAIHVPQVVIGFIVSVQASQKVTLTYLLRLSAGLFHQRPRGERPVERSSRLDGYLIGLPIQQQ